MITIHQKETMLIGWIYKMMINCNFVNFKKKNLMKALYQSYAVNDEHRISFRINFFHQKAYWKFLYYSTKNPSMLYPPRPGNVTWTWISLWLPFLMMNPFLWFIWVDFSIFLIVHTSKMHVNLLIKTWNIFLQSGAGHISKIKKIHTERSSLYSN